MKEVIQIIAFILIWGGYYVAGTVLDDVNLAVSIILVLVMLVIAVWSTIESFLIIENLWE